MGVICGLEALGRGYRGPPMSPAIEDSAAGEEDAQATRIPPAPWPRQPRRDEARQPLLGDVRTRVLASFFILLVVSTAVSLLVLRQVLIARIGQDVRETLATQVEPLRELAATGRHPKTGKPIHGDLGLIFSAYLGQERAPDD